MSGAAAFGNIFNDARCEKLPSIPCIAICCDIFN